MFNTQPYDPNTQYFMVDYFDNEKVQWIRCPYQTMEQVSGIMRDIIIRGMDTSRFRVLPETYLDQPREAEYNEEKQEYVKDTITYREYHFDNRYERFSQRYKEGSLVSA